MDMLGVKVEEKANCYAYTTGKCTAGAVVFEEKSPIFFKDYAVPIYGWFSCAPGVSNL